MRPFNDALGMVKAVATTGMKTKASFILIYYFPTKEKNGKIKRDNFVSVKTKYERLESFLFTCIYRKPRRKKLWCRVYSVSETGCLATFSTSTYRAGAS